MYRYDFLPIAWLRPAFVLVVFLSVFAPRDTALLACADRVGGDADGDADGGGSDGVFSWSEPSGSPRGWFRQSAFPILATCVVCAGFLGLVLWLTAADRRTAKKQGRVAADAEIAEFETADSETARTNSDTRPPLVEAIPYGTE